LAGIISEPGRFRGMLIAGADHYILFDFGQFTLYVALQSDI